MYTSGLVFLYCVFLYSTAVLYCIAASECCSDDNDDVHGRLVRPARAQNSSGGGGGGGSGQAGHVGGGGGGRARGRDAAGR